MYARKNQIRNWRDQWYGLSNHLLNLDGEIDIYLYLFIGESNSIQSAQRYTRYLQSYKRKGCLLVSLITSQSIKSNKGHRKKGRWIRD